jgi:hypothetical protein
VFHIEDSINVKQKAQDLNCNIPTSIAILPRNFENAPSKDELVHADTTSTIRVLWRQNGIIETPIEKETESIPFVVEESFEWIGPIIFFTATFISQNPHLIDISIGVISNYLTDWFKGIRKEERKTKLDIIVETPSGVYKKIRYEGSPDGLKDLPGIIRSIKDE